MQLRESVSSTNLQLSPHLTPRRPLTPDSPSTATTRSKAQTTRAQFRAFPGSVRARRQEIRGVGDVRQVAGTRGVTTTFSSHGRTRAWVRTGTSPAGARSSLEPRSLVPVPGAHPGAGDAASPLPPAAGERRSRPGASEGEGWVKSPREPRSWVSGPRHPGAQLRLLARRALRLLHCSLAFRERLPSPGSSFIHIPFPPEYEQVQLRPARKLAAAAGSCGRRAARSRTARGARGGFPGERAPAPCAALRSEPRDKRAGPHPRSPLYLAGPRLSGDVRSRLLRGRRPAHIAASPSRQPCPAGSLRPRSRRCPRPPTPLPPPSKVSQLFCLRIFLKVSARSPGVELRCQARQPRRCTAPPFRGPLRSARPRRRAARRGHRPQSTARGPLPLPRAFFSPSGCRLPVPRVLIPLLMNILTEANAVEVNWIGQLVPGMCAPSFLGAVWNPTRRKQLASAWHPVV